MPSKAIFLDRDNTLIEDPGYLADPDGVRILPGVELALKSLAQAGYLLVVVTNQSGIARGYFTEADLASIHAKLAADLSVEGAHLDGILYCPHHPDIGEPPYRRICDCRKPLPGLVLRAAEELQHRLPQPRARRLFLRDSRPSPRRSSFRRSRDRSRRLLRGGLRRLGGG